jgi:hypothetical protein
MIHLLKPKTIGSNKIRLGPKEDGGYVVPEIILEKCSALMTYGVGVNFEYEKEFAQIYNKPVYMFDHTLGISNWSENNINYYNEGLGFEQNCKDLIEHYKNLKIDGDVFVKIDIEGAEYDYLERINIEEVSSFVNGICLEVHWLSDQSTMSRFLNIIEKMCKHFIICHLHGNNWRGCFNYNGLEIPDVLELTFINKKLVNNEEYDIQTYPINGLDYPNNPQLTEIKLEFLNQIN